jgi:hypothetical protein
VLNLTLSNWARDKGYGMGSRVGHIAGAVHGEKVHLADTGFMFEPDAANQARWRGWWRIVRVDQWGIFFVGALLGMMLPALLYVTFVASGTDIKGLAISAVLAQTIGATAGPWLGVGVAFLGVWILFKTQLDCVEGMTRSITDILWTGSARVRAWRGGDVRAVYYSVLAVVVVWGIIALKLAARTLRVRSSCSPRCTCSISTRASCLSRYDRRCGGASHSWAWRCSTRSS